MPCVATKRKKCSFVFLIMHGQLTCTQSTLKNPRVSDEAKQHAQDVLDNEIHGDQPRQDLYQVRQQNKEPNRVAGGLKA